MFVFNTTFVIQASKFQQWEQWLNNTYKPLTKNMIPMCDIGTYEVMTSENKDERTVSVQCKVSTPSDLETIHKQSPMVLGQMSSEFGQDVLYFSTILKSL
ncbi:DUF4286 family protein [Saccharicrinis fermentans]|uniref:DUF4286 domain-containing protein n=1 Tax=Saccharicrinis fermentans DSM 9555 = JCM 21142 TaxID=869213 RepID=W7YBQ6_9BACT|nr:DUF4286 family protein [Saccharicrinis fermentans]GAF01881.1 hypothetical protein JCM21142_501 [Saccharicrinis fermentans DSM 9555 = JCM 21142]